MELLALYLRKELETMLREDIRLSVIGDTARLPDEVQAMLEETCATTSGNKRMVLNLALSYGARDELLRAVRTVGQEIQQERLSPEDIDENLFADCLDTAGQPDPDLLIRTSGEMRISNFLLWQLAYAELYFTEILWPDFSVESLHKALQEFSRRERRFGMTGAQAQNEGLSDREERH
jgi:undecaprenyl diphosphate synthase